MAETPPASGHSRRTWPTVIALNARLLVCDALDCHHQVLSARRRSGLAHHRRPHGNTANVKWQTFIDAVEETLTKFSPGPTSIRKGVQRFDFTLLAAVKRHVGKSKAIRYTKTWFTPENRAAIERQNALCRSKATEPETSKLFKAALQLKWKESLDNLSNNLDIGHTWRTMKSLCGTQTLTIFAEPKLNKFRAFTRQSQRPNQPSAIPKEGKGMHLVA